jgi:hypothetical protein
MTVNGELGRTWKEVIVMYLYLPVGTEENLVKAQSEP